MVLDVGLFDRLFQSLSRAELRHAHGRHFDRLAGARIASCTSLALLGREDTETGNGHFLSAFEGIDDVIDDALYSAFGVGFGGIEDLVDPIDDVCLIHSYGC